MLTRQKVLELRTKGFTYAAIGKRYGVTRQRAHQIYRPKQEAAHALVKIAIAGGFLVRPAKCQKCGKKKWVEAHHPDYDKPLDIEWLCIKCHKNI